MRFSTVLAVLLAAAVLLGNTSCSVPGTKTVADIEAPTNLSETAKLAQDAINEVNVTLIACSVVIGQHVKDKILTPDQAQEQLDAVKRYRDDMNKAQRFLNAGQELDASRMADLLKTSVTTLHKALINRRAQP